ncbi:MAG: hypothetical protein RIR12_2622 [Bacteroidota bacterium]|jgi:hypothetical protein
MKQFFSILILTSLIITGCGSSTSDKNKIIGTWTVATAYEKRTELQNKYPTNTDRETDSLLKAQFTGMVYTFSADGKVVVANKKEKKEGTWQMMKDDKTGKELSALEIKGNDWGEAWFPSAGESLFYLKGIDNAINAHVMSAGGDGMSIVLDLSKKE